MNVFEIGTFSEKGEDNLILTSLTPKIKEINLHSFSFKKKRMKEKEKN